MIWDRVAIIGVGLIGGSLGMALRRAGVVRHVVGIGRDPQRLQVALERGAVTQWTTKFNLGVAEADVVVVCLPVDAIAQYVVTSLRANQKAVVTDVGSTKLGIIRRVRRMAAPVEQGRFVGGHPIAGSEQSGPAAARADLFEGRKVVLTPTMQTWPSTVAIVQRMWEAVGAQVQHTTAQAHDRLLAATSHMPHVVASALAVATKRQDLPWVGSGWADTTRVAAGDVDLWQAILTENRRPTLQALRNFAKVLAKFQAALESADEQRLRQLLRQGKQTRDALGS